MEFSTYIASSVEMMVELVNSADRRSGQPGHLAGVSEVEAFLQRHQMLGPNRVNPDDVTSLRSLRANIRGVFEAADETVAIERLNDILATAGVVPNLQPLDNGRRELFFAPADAPLAARVACDAGIGLAMMMVDHADRLKLCSSQSCNNVYVDRSRNRSRRYCSNSCASRSTVAAYRARQHGSDTP